MNRNWRFSKLFIILLFGLTLGQFVSPSSTVFASNPVTPPIIVPAIGFSNLSANLNSTGSTFNFSFSGNSSSYHVDLSTYANMSWDVYLDFGAGSSSPVTVSNPIKWDKYQCNKTLYFRVYNSDRTISSSIQAVTINCVVPIPAPVGTFSNLSSVLRSDNATFSFSGMGGEYQVDLSTTANMSSDVYLSFARGTSSSLTVSNPQAKWDKYQCNRTLYFRVLNYNRTIISPIIATTISCPNVFINANTQTSSQIPAGNTAVGSTAMQPTVRPIATPVATASASSAPRQPISLGVQNFEFQPITFAQPLRIFTIVINFFSHLFGRG